MTLVYANVIADLVSPISDILDSVLRSFYFDAGIPWGFGIILLTFIVRLLLVPLTYKQITSMLHMQQYQPQIKELNEKYKEDPQKKQQELMKFFKEHGINPLASCLPILFQLPFFMAMFYALRDPSLQNAISSTQPSFFFIPNLIAEPKGAELVIMLVLYCGSQLGSTIVSLTPATDATQRKLMLALPFIFVPFIIHFPAGLILYWITTNFWTFGQSFVVKWLRVRQGDPVLSGGSAGSGTSGKGDAKDGTVVAAGNGVAAVEKGPAKPPPPPPRQKKKRSGRRR
jgi:YidC/Oxa1 family membrane protein insertase